MIVIPEWKWLTLRILTLIDSTQSKKIRSFCFHIFVSASVSRMVWYLRDSEKSSQKYHVSSQKYHVPLYAIAHVVITNNDYARCYWLKKRILISIGSPHPNMAMTYCIEVMNPVCGRAVFSSDVTTDVVEVNNNCLRLRWQYCHENNDDLIRLNKMISCQRSW